MLPAAEIYRLAKSSLRRYATHPEYEDIVQEGVIVAWHALSRYEGPHADRRIVARAARWGAAAYLKSHRCRQPLQVEGKPGHTYARVPLFDLLPFDQANLEELPAGPFAAPDFSEPLVERLTAAQIAAAARETLPTRWYRVLCALADGLTQAEIAEQIGVSRGRVAQIRAQALRRMQQSGALG